MIPKLKVLDLFSGIGGFSLGLERTGGFETVAFCEIDKFCQKVLKKHWPDVPIYEDVRTLNYEGSVNIICGGFPCQDISTAGRGAGLEGDRSGLWFEFFRIIKEVGPSWAIIENVTALRGRGLSTILQNLCSIGYDAEWHCIPATYVGAHHQRDRVWIIAYPNSERSEARANRAGRETRPNFDRRCEGPVMAYTHGMREPQQEGRKQDKRGRTINRGEDLANPTSKRQQRLRELIKSLCSEPNKEGEAINVVPSCEPFKWSPEPDVGRVAHGVPDRSHRLTGLGNAVVPQIPEIIGKSILESISNGR